MEAAGVLITPDSLRELAAQAEAEANRLREASKAKRIEAVRLRREADALEGALRFAPPPSEPTPSARAELAGRIAEWLAGQKEPRSSGEIGDHFGVSYGRARAALDLLVESGLVFRSGLKRGTRYRIARDGEVNVEPRPFGERWHERVRDEAIRLEVFTIADMREALGDHMADATLYRWLTQLVDDGILSCVKEGNRNVYAYEPKAARPDPTRARRLEPLPGRLRGSVVVSGRTERGARREVREVLQSVRKQGATVKPQKHGYAIEINGEVVTSVPKTASDHRSIANARSAIRRGGLDA